MSLSLIGVKAFKVIINFLLQVSGVKHLSLMTV